MIALLLLAKVNLAGTAAICAVFALRKLVRNRLGAHAAHSLWSLPPLAAAASLAPARTIVVSIPNFQAGAQPVLPTFPAPATGSYLLLAFWGMGIALSLIVLILRQRRFMARLGRLTPSSDRRVVKAELAGAGPAVIGVWAPRIVLPADFDERYDSAARAAIMVHEQAHLSAGHIQINGLVALIRCTCWFNPFVHIAARALRLDQELTCDARVLAQYPAGRRAYGEALLRTQLNAHALPLGCYWPPSGAESLKERLLMLKMPAPSRRARLAGIGLTIAAAAASAAAAWGAQPPRKISGPVRAEPQTTGTFAAALNEDALQKQPQASLRPEQLRLAENCAAEKARPHPNRSINCSPIVRTAGPGISEQSIEVPYGPEGAGASPSDQAHVTIANSVAGHKGLAAPPKPAPGNEIAPPDWIDKPTSADLAPYYPGDAAKQDVQGMAMVRCQVGETGKTHDCSLLSETPEGAHFGDAALKMAETFTMKPPTGGASATVNIPIKFQLQ